MPSRPATVLSVLTAIAVLIGGTALAADAPADPSFALTSDVPALSYSFGIFRQGDPGATYNFSIYNRAAPIGTTSPTSLSTVTSFGDPASIVLSTGSAQHIVPGGQADMQLILNTNEPGNLEVVYTMRFTSDPVPAASPVDLTIAGDVTILRQGDYDADSDVDASDYVLWRKTLNQLVTPGTGADGNKNGVVDQADYGVWRANFTDPSLSGSGAAVGLSLGSTVPEPATFALLSIGFFMFSLAGRRRHVRLSPPS